VANIFILKAKKLSIRPYLREKPFGCLKPLWTLLSALIQSHIQSQYWNCVLCSPRWAILGTSWKELPKIK